LQATPRSERSTRFVGHAADLGAQYGQVALEFGNPFVHGRSGGVGDASRVARVEA